MVDTKVNLCGWVLDNPVIATSGTFGYGKEFSKFYDINMLGTFSFKGTTVEPRFGNPLPRIADCDSGMLLSIGLQNRFCKTNACRYRYNFHRKVGGKRRRGRHKHD